MIKKAFCVLFCLSLIFLHGCSQSKQIDTASLAETVTVSLKGGKPLYTFYIIGGGEDVNSVSVTANSLDCAQRLAKSSYIPNLSLSKLELYVASDEVYDKVLRGDVCYISSKYYLSPLILAAVSDNETISLFNNSKDVTNRVEEHILLLKNNNGVSANVLSIYNNFQAESINDFYISYFNSKSELKSKPFKIESKK